MTRKKTGDTKRKPGEQWYELVEGLDPRGITNVPMTKGVYVMGKIDEMTIVEIPGNATEADAKGIMRNVRAMGIKSAILIVRAGVRFLKLRPTTEGETKDLDAVLAEQAVQRAQKSMDELPPQPTEEGKAPDA